jgi:hypothetical protein
MFVVVPVLFFLPGLLLAALLGIRGWRLAAIAPAVTFGLVATGGPVLDALGVPWSLLSFAAWTAGVAVLLAAAGWLWGRFRRARRATPDADGAADDVADDPAGPLTRARWEHLVVGGGVLLGMVVGAVVFLRGTGGLGVTTQEWDAPFHANAVRWIAEHGAAVPQALAPTAGLPADAPYFYPIAYHSLLSIVVQLFSVTPSWALNAAALTVVLIWPLAVAALGMSWRVPAPIVAVAAAVSTWFSAFPFDSLWRGPLWPYVAGLALLPAVLALGRQLLERGPFVRPAVVIALGITGVVAMHPSLAFILLVYVLALTAALVLRLEPVRWRAAALPLVVTAVLTVVVLLPVVLPARAQSAGVQGARWPEFATQAEGFGQVLLFSPVTTNPQWWLGLAALVGVVLMVLRRRLLWLVAAYLVIGAAYAATASMDNALINTLSGPFYNDAWRLAAPLPLADAFAAGELLVAASAWLAPRLRLGASWPAVVGTTTAALLALALLGNGAYMNRNIEQLGWPYGDGPTVTAGEIEAYEWLAEHVEPGEQVMNDPLDGSVWMYSFAGVEPMMFTFYGAPAGSPINRLQNRLNQMDHAPSVRRLLDEENVRYVIVGDGFVRPHSERAVGLKYLSGVDGLERVFRNDDATIYEVLPAVPEG